MDKIQEMQQITERFNSICSLENVTSKVTAIDSLIEDTNSSTLPTIIKERLVKRFAENQVCLIASLDFCSVEE